ncbi:hypothetical protein SDC9_172415 [bioreactor metagenome]|uniref:Uncharacterized protein n=1 Tax=bioreactor metagenome TaxID=1076179 RepID=A0A645GDN1_9ZZZZ
MDPVRLGEHGYIQSVVDDEHFPVSVGYLPDLLRPFEKPAPVRVLVAQLHDIGSPFVCESRDLDRRPAE